MKKIAPALVLALGFTGIALINPAQAATTDVVAFADTFTNARHAARNYATSTDLQVHDTSGRTRHAFLKFAVPAAEGRLEQVTLRLRSLESNSRGVTVYRTGSSWAESTLTWDTMPTERTLLGSSDALVAGTTEVISLDPALVTPGEVLALRVETSAKKALSFLATEATTSVPPTLAVALPPSTPTPTPTPTPSPTPTPTPTPTPSPTPTSSGCVKPDASNTGSSGTLTAYSGSNYISDPGTVIDGKAINGGVTIAAANVTIKNSTVNGTIGVVTTTGARIVRTTNKGVWVSSAQDVVIDSNNIGFATEGDAMHVTSDNGSMVKDVTISNNYIHDPRPQPGAHWDGLQVRGSTNLNVACNNFQLGTPTQEYNASVYLEGGANGGNSATVVDNNWLFGGAFGFMYGADNDGRTRLTNNHFGGQYLWQSDTSSAACYTGGGPGPAVQTGNDLRGEPITPCL